MWYPGASDPGRRRHAGTGRGGALCPVARDAVAARSARAYRGGLLRATAAQRNPRPDPPARRPQWTDPARRRGGRALGRHAAGRFHLLGRQELSQPAGRHRGGRRADCRYRRAGGAYGGRWRFRRPAQWRDHLAASAAADLRMGGLAVRQVGHHRSQPQSRGRGEGPQRRCAAVANTRARSGNTTTCG